MHSRGGTGNKKLHVQHHPHKAQRRPSTTATAFPHHPQSPRNASPTPHSPRSRSVSPSRAVESTFQPDRTRSQSPSRRFPGNAAISPSQPPQLPLSSSSPFPHHSHQPYLSLSHLNTNPHTTNPACRPTFPPTPALHHHTPPPPPQFPHYQPHPLFTTTTRGISMISKMRATEEVPDLPDKKTHGEYYDPHTKLLTEIKRDELKMLPWEQKQRRLFERTLKNKYNRLKALGLRDPFATDLNQKIKIPENMQYIENAHELVENLKLYNPQVPRERLALQYASRKPASNLIADEHVATQGKKQAAGKARGLKEENPDVNDPDHKMKELLTKAQQDEAKRRETYEELKKARQEFEKGKLLYEYQNEAEQLRNPISEYYRKRQEQKDAVEAAMKKRQVDGPVNLADIVKSQQEKYSKTIVPTVAISGLNVDRQPHQPPQQQPREDDHPPNTPTKRKTEKIILQQRRKRKSPVQHYEYMMQMRQGMLGTLSQSTAEPIPVELHATLSEATSAPPPQPIQLSSHTLGKDTNVQDGKNKKKKKGKHQHDNSLPQGVVRSDEIPQPKLHQVSPMDGFLKQESQKFDAKLAKVRAKKLVKLEAKYRELQQIGMSIDVPLHSLDQLSSEHSSSPSNTGSKFPSQPSAMKSKTVQELDEFDMSSEDFESSWGRKRPPSQHSPSQSSSFATRLHQPPFNIQENSIDTENQPEAVRHKLSPRQGAAVRSPTHLPQFQQPGRLPQQSQREERPSRTLLRDPPSSTPPLAVQSQFTPTQPGTTRRLTPTHQENNQLHDQIFTDSLTAHLSPSPAVQSASKQHTAPVVPGQAFQAEYPHLSPQDQYEKHLIRGALGNPATLADHYEEFDQDGVRKTSRMTYSPTVSPEYEHLILPTSHIKPYVVSLNPTPPEQLLLDDQDRIQNVQQQLLNMQHALSDQIKMLRDGVYLTPQMESEIDKNIQKVQQLKDELDAKTHTKQQRIELIENASMLSIRKPVLQDQRPDLIAETAFEQFVDRWFTPRRDHRDEAVLTPFEKKINAIFPSNQTLSQQRDDVLAEIKALKREWSRPQAEIDKENELLAHEIKVSTIALQQEAEYKRLELMSLWNLKLHQALGDEEFIKYKVKQRELKIDPDYRKIPFTSVEVPWLNKIPGMKSFMKISNMWDKMTEEVETERITDVRAQFPDPNHPTRVQFENDFAANQKARKERREAHAAEKQRNLDEYLTSFNQAMGNSTPSPTEEHASAVKQYNYLNNQAISAQELIKQRSGMLSNLFGWTAKANSAEYRAATERTMEQNMQLYNDYNKLHHDKVSNEASQFDLSRRFAGLSSEHVSAHVSPDTQAQEHLDNNNNNNNRADETVDQGLSDNNLISEHTFINPLKLRVKALSSPRYGVIGTSTESSQFTPVAVHPNSNYQGSQLKQDLSHLNDPVILDASYSQSAKTVSGPPMLHPNLDFSADDTTQQSAKIPSFVADEDSFTTTLYDINGNPITIVSKRNRATVDVATTPLGRGQHSADVQHHSPVPIYNVSIPKKLKQKFSILDDLFPEQGDEQTRESAEQLKALDRFTMLLREQEDSLLDHLEKQHKIDFSQIDLYSGKTYPELALEHFQDSFQLKRLEALYKAQYLREKMYQIKQNDRHREAKTAFLEYKLKQIEQGRANPLIENRSSRKGDNGAKTNVVNIGEGPFIDFIDISAVHDGPDEIESMQLGKSARGKQARSEENQQSDVNGQPAAQFRAKFRTPDGKEYYGTTTDVLNHDDLREAELEQKEEENDHIVFFEFGFPPESLRSAPNPDHLKTIREHPNPNDDDHDDDDDDDHDDDEEFHDVDVVEFDANGKVIRRLKSNTSSAENSKKTLHKDSSAKKNDLGDKKEETIIGADEIGDPAVDQMYNRQLTEEFTNLSHSITQAAQLASKQSASKRTAQTTTHNDAILDSLPLHDPLVSMPSTPSPFVAPTTREFLSKIEEAEHYGAQMNVTTSSTANPFGDSEVAPKNSTALSDTLFSAPTHHSQSSLAKQLNMTSQGPPSSNPLLEAMSLPQDGMDDVRPEDLYTASVLLEAERNEREHIIAQVHKEKKMSSKDQASLQQDFEHVDNDALYADFDSEIGSDMHDNRVSSKSHGDVNMRDDFETSLMATHHKTDAIGNQPSTIANLDPRSLPNSINRPRTSKRNFNPDATVADGWWGEESSDDVDTNKRKQQLPPGYQTDSEGIVVDPRIAPLLPDDHDFEPAVTAREILKVLKRSKLDEEQEKLREASLSLPTKAQREEERQRRVERMQQRAVDVFKTLNAVTDDQLEMWLKKYDNPLKHLYPGLLELTQQRKRLQGRKEQRERLAKNQTALATVSSSPPSSTPSIPTIGNLPPKPRVYQKYNQPLTPAQRNDIVSRNFTPVLTGDPLLTRATYSKGKSLSYNRFSKDAMLNPLLSSQESIALAQNEHFSQLQMREQLLLDEDQVQLPENYVKELIHTHLAYSDDEFNPRFDDGEDKHDRLDSKTKALSDPIARRELQLKQQYLSTVYTHDNMIFEQNNVNVNAMQIGLSLKEQKRKVMGELQQKALRIQDPRYDEHYRNMQVSKLNVDKAIAMFPYTADVEFCIEDIIRQDKIALLEQEQMKKRLFIKVKQEERLFGAKSPEQQLQEAREIFLLPRQRLHPEVDVSADQQEAIFIDNVLKYGSALQISSLLSTAQNNTFRPQTHQLLLGDSSTNNPQPATVLSSLRSSLSQFATFTLPINTPSPTTPHPTKSLSKRAKQRAVDNNDEFLSEDSDWTYTETETDDDNSNTPLQHLPALSSQFLTEIEQGLATAHLSPLPSQNEDTTAFSGPLPDVDPGKAGQHTHQLHLYNPPSSTAKPSDVNEVVETRPLKHRQLRDLKQRIQNDDLYNEPVSHSFLTPPPPLTSRKTKGLREKRVSGVGLPSSSQSPTTTDQESSSDYLLSSEITSDIASDAGGNSTGTERPYPPSSPPPLSSKSHKKPPSETIVTLLDNKTAVVISTDKLSDAKKQKVLDKLKQLKALKQDKKGEQQTTAVAHSPQSLLQSQPHSHTQSPPTPPLQSSMLGVLISTCRLLTSAVESASTTSLFPHHDSSNASHIIHAQPCRNTRNNTANTNNTLHSTPSLPHYSQPHVLDIRRYAGLATSPPLPTSSPPLSQSSRRFADQSNKKQKKSDKAEKKSKKSKRAAASDDSDDDLLTQFPASSPLSAGQRPHASARQPPPTSRLESDLDVPNAGGHETTQDHPLATPVTEEAEPAIEEEFDFETWQQVLASGDMAALDKLAQAQSRVTDSKPTDLKNVSDNFAIPLHTQPFEDSPLDRTSTVSTPAKSAPKQPLSQTRRSHIADEDEAAKELTPEEHYQEFLRQALEASINPPKPPKKDKKAKKDKKSVDAAQAPPPPPKTDYDLFMERAFDDEIRKKTPAFSDQFVAAASARTGLAGIYNTTPSARKPAQSEQPQPTDPSTQQLFYKKPVKKTPSSSTSPSSTLIPPSPASLKAEPVSSSIEEVYVSDAQESSQTQDSKQKQQQPGTSRSDVDLLAPRAEQPTEARFVPHSSDLEQTIPPDASTPPQPSPDLTLRYKKPVKPFLSSVKPVEHETKPQQTSQRVFFQDEPVSTFGFDSSPPPSVPPSPPPSPPPPPSRPPPPPPSPPPGSAPPFKSHHSDDEDIYPSRTDSGTAATTDTTPSDAGKKIFFKRPIRKSGISAFTSTPLEPDYQPSADDFARLTQSTDSPIIESYGDEGRVIEAEVVDSHPPSNIEQGKFTSRRRKDDQEDDHVDDAEIPLDDVHHVEPDETITANKRRKSPSEPEVAEPEEDMEENGEGNEEDGEEYEEDGDEDQEYIDLPEGTTVQHDEQGNPHYFDKNGHHFTFDEDDNILYVDEHGFPIGYNDDGTVAWRVDMQQRGVVNGEGRPYDATKLPPNVFRMLFGDIDPEQFQNMQEQQRAAEQMRQETEQSMFGRTPDGKPLDPTKKNPYSFNFDPDHIEYPMEMILPQGAFKDDNGQYHFPPGVYLDEAGNVRVPGDEAQFAERQKLKASFKQGQLDEHKMWREEQNNLKLHNSRTFRQADITYIPTRVREAYAKEIATAQWYKKQLERGEEMWINRAVVNTKHAFQDQREMQVKFAKRREARRRQIQSIFTQRERQLLGTIHQQKQRLVRDVAVRSMEISKRLAGFLDLKDFNDIWTPPTYSPPIQEYLTDAVLNEERKKIYDQLAHDENILQTITNDLDTAHLFLKFTPPGSRSKTIPSLHEQGPDMEYQEPILQWVYSLDFATFQPIPPPQQQQQQQDRPIEPYSTLRGIPQKLPPPLSSRYQSQHLNSYNEQDEHGKRNNPLTPAQLEEITSLIADLNNFTQPALESIREAAGPIVFKHQKASKHAKAQFARHEIVQSMRDDRKYFGVKMNRHSNELAAFQAMPVRYASDITLTPIVPDVYSHEVQADLDELRDQIRKTLPEVPLPKKVWDDYSTWYPKESDLDINEVSARAQWLMFYIEHMYNVHNLPDYPGFRNNQQKKNNKKRPALYSDVPSWKQVEKLRTPEILDYVDPDLVQRQKEIQDSMVEAELINRRRADIAEQDLTLDYSVELSSVAISDWKAKMSKGIVATIGVDGQTEGKEGEEKKAPQVAKGKQAPIPMPVQFDRFHFYTGDAMRNTASYHNVDSARRRMASQSPFNNTMQVIGRNGIHPIFFQLRGNPYQLYSSIMSTPSASFNTQNARSNNTHNFQPPPHHAHRTSQHAFNSTLHNPSNPAYQPYEQQQQQQQQEQDSATDTTTTNIYNESIQDFFVDDDQISDKNEEMQDDLIAARAKLEATLPDPAKPLTMTTRNEYKPDFSTLPDFQLVLSPETNPDIHIVHHSPADHDEFIMQKTIEHEEAKARGEIESEFELELTRDDYYFWGADGLIEARDPMVDWRREKEFMREVEIINNEIRKRNARRARQRQERKQREQLQAQGKPLPPPHLGRSPQPLNTTKEQLIIPPLPSPISDLLRPFSSKHPSTHPLFAKYYPAQAQAFAKVMDTVLSFQYSLVHIAHTLHRNIMYDRQKTEFRIKRRQVAEFRRLNPVLAQRTPFPDPPIFATPEEVSEQLELKLGETICYDSDSLLTKLKKVTRRKGLQTVLHSHRVVMYQQTRLGSLYFKAISDTYQNRQDYAEKLRQEEIETMRKMQKM